MDAVKYWKRTLLQWVKICNFIDKAFYNLEQTDIEAFFEEFKTHIKGNYFSKTDLSSFLNDHYPEFEPHFDDEKALSSNDYLYVYSLLLHFSCVKCGEEFFQKQCQQLSEHAQQNITTFFKKLLDTNSFTKDKLRQAISSISIIHPPKAYLPCRESPVKTPLKNQISPPTPRGTLLQEKNKELHSLKVQLENEIYEKNMLELEIKQNQDKILKLTQDLKKSNQTIMDLKNELIYKSSYGDSEDKCSENKEISRKLRKEIAQKECEIAEQREHFNILMEQKDIISEKLKLAENKMKLFQNKSEELTIKMDELIHELERRDCTIQVLSETKAELELYISEMRSSASSRPDLNISAECLDISRTTNSSDSVTSPENLGCSVVDLHLREKENENIKLRDEIELLRLDNASLSKHIKDTTMRYSKLFDICKENLITEEDAGPLENFMIFSNCVEKIALKYEKQFSIVNELQESNNAIREHNQQLRSIVCTYEKEIKDFDEKLIALQVENQLLLSCKNELDVDLTVAKGRLEEISNEHLENVKKIEALLVLLAVKCDSEQDFKKQITDLEKNVESIQRTLQKEFNYKSSLLDTAENKPVRHCKENQELSLKNIEIYSKFEGSISKLKEQRNSISSLEFEIKDMQFNREKEKRSYENRFLTLKQHFANMENNLKELLDGKEIQIKEKCNIIKKLADERDKSAEERYRSKNIINALESEKDDLKNQIKRFKTEVKTLKSLLKKDKEFLQKLKTDRNKQTLIITNLQTEKETLINSILEKINSFRLSLDQHEKNVDAEMGIRAKQEFDLRDELCNIQAQKTSLENELHDISLKYMTVKENQIRQTDCFTNLIDKLKTHLIKESSTDYEGAAQDADLANVLTVYIDQILQKLQHLTSESLKNEEEIKNLSKTVQLLGQTKKTLEHNIILSETRIRELKEDFESELQCEKNKSVNELKRLGDDLKNLSDVCDHLTEENLTLQSKFSDLQVSNEHLIDENKMLKAKNSILESERLNQMAVADQLLNTKTELKTQVTNMQSCVKKLEIEIESAQKLLTVKTHDAERLLEKHQIAENTIESLRKLVTELQTKALVLENEVAYKEKTKEELKNANACINELKEHKCSLENKCQRLEIQIEKLKDDIAQMNSEILKVQYERDTLNGEIEFMKKSKVSTESHMEKCNKEIDEQKSNVSRLIKEIASIRKEKEAINHEKNRVIEQLEEKTDMYTILQENYKNVVGKLELAEKDIFEKQKTFKSAQLKLEKLRVENTRLEENIENNKKCLEKQTLELEEIRANSLEFKREKETVRYELEALKSSSTILERENNKLNLECKTLSEKLLGCEKKYNQLEMELKTLERLNETLRQEKENAESSEKDLKSLKETLEKNRANLEEKVRKLAKSLNETSLTISRQEKEKVSLNLEIGDLNKQLQESRSLYNMKLKENKDLAANLIDVKNENCKLLELNNKCQLDAKEIREENNRLNDQLSKLSLRLKITQEEHETTKKELDTLRTDIEIKKNEADTIKSDHLATVERLKEIEVLVEEQQTKKSEFFEKICSLDSQISKMTVELQNSHEMLKQEKKMNEKLNTDISILQAKLQKSRLTCEENEKRWNEEREHLLTEVKASDERIKETRLELEGKLEKMKNKMKTLYNDEITKMKKKQELEMAVLKSEHETYKTQSEKLEEHTKKLSNQIFRLNENILEHQKQNTFLKTKIKDLESKSHLSNRVVNTLPSQSSARQCLGSNLRMEDEEGEVFNNTYLSDLKSGRISEMFCRDICAQELQYRNSLLPPHLKSTYMAQFDHQMGEDEIRETPNLDDSSSTLLNTGQRKKVSGATSYKRPGPPTPSKNAGRLSFGGSGEPSREILRETDIGNVQCTKTPAKFKLFSSRLSMKDENTPPNKRRLSNLFKKK